jgi:hypothetical protein
VLITSDEETIIDDVRLHPDLYGVYPLTSFQELKEILVDPLPVGCTLIVSGSLFRVCFRIPICYVPQVIFDASHSGTMLDLPHHHCNSVYVPWQSKGRRRTVTLRNMNGWSPHHPSLRRLTSA